MSRGWPGEPITARTLPELNESLGRGSLGETFAALHQVTGERIAVMRFYRALVIDPALQRFKEEEVPTLRAFARPGIVPFSEFFRLGDDLAFAMPFLAGEDIRRYRSRPLLEILDAFDSLLENLAACHDAGIVHGGLRASNLLCDNDGKIQIAGLGFSALVHRIPGPREHRIRSADAGLSPALRAGKSKVSIADDMFALGALLYEWVAGRPPPAIESTGPRVLPPIALPGSDEPVPTEFSVCVAAMLRTDPADRPPSIPSVRAALAETRSRLPDEEIAKSKSSARSAFPERASLTSPSAAPSTPGPSAVETQAVSNAVRNAWLALLCVVVIGAAMVFWAESATESSPSKSESAVDSIRARDPDLDVAEAPTVDPPLDQSPSVTSFSTERQRTALNEAYLELTDRVAVLAGRGAGDWAEPEFSEASEALESMKSALGRNDWSGAESAETRIRGGVETMNDRVSRLLAESLRSGQLALSADDSELATQHFQLAVRLDPGNALAERGLARAARRPEVLQLLADAQREASRPGRVDAALRIARQIPVIDPEYAPARNLIGDLEGRRAANALAAELARHRERAEGFVAQERWSDAVAEYEAALARRSDFLVAQTALPRVRERAALDATLEAFVRDTDRIFSRSGRQEAGRTIEAGNRVTDPGPRLIRQLTTVRTALELANTPVTVQLLSDDQTDVTIFHVGRQGSFARKPLELLPGDYTLVGSRNGYRDVRLRLEVPAGAGPMEFAIRCEEAL